MATPKTLVNGAGQVALGYFDEPVSHINPHAFEYQTVTRKPASRLRKYFSYKQFQYFGAISEDLIFGCALADIRYVGACFAYVYQPSTKRMLTWQSKTPLALGLSMSDRTDNGISLFKVGQKEASQSYRLYADGTREKALNIQFYDALSIDARMLESPDFQAKSLCTPCAVNGWVYAQKTAALRVEGSLSCELGTFNLGELDCYGHHDFSSGFMRRETFWNWACFSAAPNDERPALGLNLSWGVNETGYSENCIWVGDQHQALPQVQFDYQRNALLDTWQIKSEDGSVNLRFEPEGKHSETLNAWVLASDFHQIFGRFYGEIRCANGEILKIESLWGFVEHQFSRW